MAGEEDEQQRRNRETRMRKGKEATTASARREKVEQNPYVPKTRKRRDSKLFGDSSESQMDYSSQVVDPTPAHDYAVYEEGFAGYDRMEEKAMFYQPQEEAEDEEQAGDEEVVEADYLAADDVVPKPESEPRRRRRRAPLIPSCPVIGPPFPIGLETTLFVTIRFSLDLILIVFYVCLIVLVCD